MKWNRKLKIPDRLLERRTLCFSSYKNRQLKKTDELELGKEKKSACLMFIMFAMFILSEGNFFKISVLSQYIV